jgi:hypothetical protein
MQAIHVTCHAPTGTLPARYVATAASGKVGIKAGAIPADTDPFRYTAELLCKRLNWEDYGNLLGGTLADGSQVFVFDHILSRKEK